ncbi:MAG TPA: NUDIX domain-containing protein [Chitinophagaceae bacterium]|nr:NUDIX domain-containing protein [Chitinophagaceae bacterium]
MEFNEHTPVDAGIEKKLTVDSFTIRVYGILMDSNKRVLLSDEFIRGDYFTKLPGGGMEFGEGTRDCLKREFMEETGLDVTIGEHIYTTDYFQISAFNKKNQIVSIYYYAHAKEPVNVVSKTIPFDFTPEQVSDPNGQSEVLRWIEWDDLSEDSVSLPIDKIVVKMIKGN